MTLPVSFNEPTSLLQRVTEDMVSDFAIAISISHRPWEPYHVAEAGCKAASLAHISYFPDHCLGQNC